MDDLITDEALEAANERGQRSIASGPCAVSARYEEGQAQRIVVELDNGCAFAFPVKQAEGLAGAKAADLKVIEVTPSGLGLHWPNLDADLGVPALVRGVLGSRKWMAQLGQVGGKSQSERKAAAARANGKKGGRPIKVGGRIRDVYGASGQHYRTLKATPSYDVSVYGGVLLVFEKGSSAGPRIIDAPIVDRGLRSIEDDPSIDYILWIRAHDEESRQRIVSDLKAGFRFGA
tara:strand:- start:1385 stop:2080 length:696 start_codon:yes stop_codon:yes gene_type:complete